MTQAEIDRALAAPTIAVPLAGQILGLGRNAAYRAAETGGIPSLRVGGKLRVPTAKLREMLNGNGPGLVDGEMPAPAEEKRIGRPRKRPELGRRRNVSLRIGAKIIDKIEEASILAGRSMSEEMERRIEVSFEVAELRTIIREELEAYRARHSDEMEPTRWGQPLAYSFSHMNGEPRDA